MLNSAGRNETTFVFESLDDLLIGILDVGSLVIRNLVSELSVVVDGARRSARINDLLGHTDLVIFLTKARSTVYDSSTRGGYDEVASDNTEATLVLHVGEVGEERNILLTVKVRAFHLSQNFNFLDVAHFLYVLQQTFEADVGLALVFVKELHVVEIRVDSSCQVGRQCPRCSCPGDERSFGVFYEREGDDDGGVVDIFIVLSSLKI